jgi:AcrR family transcriptional regulator
MRPVASCGRYHDPIVSATPQQPPAGSASVGEAEQSAARDAAASRPRTGGRKSTDTAARLRQAALVAFEDLGWQATRVADITRLAGVSHGTFYTYYENKAALAEDLIRSSMADLMALASEPWKANDVRGALERVIGGFLDVYQRDRVILRTWLEAARENRRFSVRYLEARGAYVDRVAELVAAVTAASGRHEGRPPRTIASALVAMVEHFAYCWAVLGEDHDRDDAVAALVVIWGSTLNELAGFPVV